ncbi:MAG: KpsF/GutQ family sugar-phosphate isomerase [Cellvibrionaceae bacterium]|nr:KpsF/GutQ family sugar-phosphate isomerase [Cellvibrionaceae bacterium]
MTRQLPQDSQQQHRQKVLLTAGKRTITMETDAVKALSTRLDHHFLQACELILESRGRTIVTGMGKSGHIGKKIAATLASTGSPAFFVHPGEASHGDLGMITADDTVIAISNSGTSAEIMTLLPLFKRLGLALISMTGDAASPLAQMADVNLDVSVPCEACPLGLAPTSSTTATLVMGDALAVALLEARGFTAEDFAFSHPGGALGRRLLIKVGDIMHRGTALPVVKDEANLGEALLEMSRKGLGITAVVNAQQRLCGVYTDGDLRRTLDQHTDIHSVRIRELMSPEPITVSEQLLAAEALGLMEKNAITAVIVSDAQQHPIGVIHMHDILKAGIL